SSWAPRRPPTPDGLPVRDAERVDLEVLGAGQGVRPGREAALAEHTRADERPAWCAEGVGEDPVPVRRHDAEAVPSRLVPLLDQDAPGAPHRCAAPDADAAVAHVTDEREADRRQQRLRLVGGDRAAAPVQPGLTRLDLLADVVDQVPGDEADAVLPQ